MSAKTQKSSKSNKIRLEDLFGHLSIDSDSDASKYHHPSTVPLAAQQTATERISSLPNGFANDDVYNKHKTVGSMEANNGSGTDS